MEKVVAVESSSWISEVDPGVVNREAAEGGFL